MRQQKMQRNLVPAAHEVAREQFKIAGDYFARTTSSDKTLQIKKDANRITFSSNNISGEIDLKQGTY